MQVTGECLRTKQPMPNHTYVQACRSYTTSTLTFCCFRSSTLLRRQQHLQQHLRIRLQSVTGHSSAQTKMHEPSLHMPVDCCTDTSVTRIRMDIQIVKCCTGTCQLLYRHLYHSNWNGHKTSSAVGKAVYKNTHQTKKIIKEMMPIAMNAKSGLISSCFFCSM